MASTGDLVAYLDLNNERFIAASKQAQAEAKIMGIAVQNAVGGGPGGALGKGGTQSIQAAGFAMQDFFSVLNNGGANAGARAFGAISNNIPQMLAGLGPMGMAIGAIGSGLATIIVPQLLATEDQTKKVSDELSRQADIYDRIVSGIQRRLKMENEIRDFMKEGSEKDVKAAAQRTDDEMKAIQEEIKVRSEQFRGDINRANRDMPGAVVKSGGPGQAFDDMGRINNGVRFDVNDPELAKRFEKEMARLNELQQKERELEAQKKKLAEVQPEARARDAGKNQEEAFKREMRAFEEAMERKKRLWDETRSPMEKYQQRVQEINDEFVAGNIDEDLLKRGMLKAQSLREGSKSMQEGVGFGTSAAASAILRATSEQSKRDDSIALARQAVDAAKEQLRELQRIGKALDTNVWQPVVIGP